MQTVGINGEQAVCGRFNVSFFGGKDECRKNLFHLKKLIF